MSYLFTSESVSEGHPDKVADQISDALLDEFLAYDKNSKVACETLVTTGQVVLAGEVKSSAYVDVQEVARGVIEKIGYTKSEYQFEAKSCGVFSSIHEQSGDINRGVEREDPYNQGAGDQGMMFGYATNETENYMPLALDLSHSLLWELAEIRKNENDLMPYLRPDAKSQVTIEYDDNGKPLRIDTIVVSTQHDEFITAKGITQEEADLAMQKKIAEDVKSILIPRVKAQYPAHVQALFNDDIIYHVNPTGKFVIGGPHGDTGLTGRKIIVDTYGGKGAHGGGAFSGKDPSKVDRSAAYAPVNILKITNTGMKVIIPTIFGRIRKLAELTPMISIASICSVTRMVPISEAMLLPTLPARINDMMEEENSNRIISRVVYPIVNLGMSGELIFSEIWMLKY